jgi:predicted hydrocarbon binding protein
MGRLLKVKSIFYNLDNPIEITMSPNAWAYYQAWQETRESELQDSTNSIELALWGRLSFYALKLAILFTVGQFNYQIGTQVGLEHVIEACRQVDEYFLPIGLIVAEEVAREETTNLQNKILGTLNRNGGKIKERDLLKKLHVKLKDVKEAEEALIESEEIEVIQSGSTRWVLLRQINRKEKATIKPKTISETKVSQMSQLSHNNKCRMNSDSISGIRGTAATEGTVGTIAAPKGGSNLAETDPDVPAIGPHPKRNLSTPIRKQNEEASCPICKVDIGPGHSSLTFEGVNYCASCPTHFKEIRNSVKALTEKNNSLGPTTAEIYEICEK